VKPHRTAAALARLATLPRNVRWVPAPAAPTWRDGAPLAFGFVAIFIATEFAVAWIGGAP